MRHKEVKEPARGELLRAFSQTPPEFEKGITDTLARLQGEKEGSPVKRKMRYVPVLAAALALLLVVAAAAAALYPGTVERFREAFGEGYLRGEETAELNESCTLGDVSYTVTDAVWEDGVLYGTVVMRPREGANIVLIPEDYTKERRRRRMQRAMPSLPQSAGRKSCWPNAYRMAMSSRESCSRATSAISSLRRGRERFSRPLKFMVGTGTSTMHLRIHCA